MGQPAIENTTPFAVEALWVADEEGRPVVAPIVQASFDIGRGGTLELAQEQIAVSFGGELHGEPGESSARFEPEFAFTKPATDVVLIAHAHAPSRRATALDVSFRVGPVERHARVTGDRVFRKRLFGISVSAPEPFERIPLVYERAYGGWDRSHPDPERHKFLPENPVGVGFRARGARFEEGARLPNVEDPRALLSRYRGKSQPVGFGYTCPHWLPRAAFAGTYDDAWARTRMPRLPADFDRRFFNGASAGLIAPGYLRGNEAVSARGVSAEGSLSFRLPGIEPPTSVVALRSGVDRSLPTKLDTVIVDLDARKLILVWRSFTTLRDGPLDVRAIGFSATNAPQRRPVEIPENVVPLRPQRAA